MTDPTATIIDTGTLVGQVVSDRYEVKQHLGDGSMGIVFLAEHMHMKKKVALKVMRPEFLSNPEAVERFQREAQATGHIEHPNVCSASDFGQLDDERFFLVMEYLEGKTLSEVIAEDERLVPERAVKITRQIAAGLQRAHELDVIHRDLKPDNIILIEREGNPDFVKITDFGVARVEVVNEQKLTRAGTTMGTPIYMSPEQAVAKRADERSDLYTLGIMLFEMLTGSVPFYSKSLAVILSMHTKETPPRMSDVAPDALVPLDLEMIVEKLLAKKPEDRYQSAAELIEALDRVDLTPYVPGLGGPPIPAATGEPVESVEQALSGLGDLTSDADEMPDPTATIDDALSGGDAFSDAEDESDELDPAELAPIGAVPLPPSTSSPVSGLQNKFMALPPGKRYAAIFGLVALFALPLIVAVVVLATGSDDGADPGPEEDTPGEMTFAESEVEPADLEDERKEFLDDHDLVEKVSAAGPADTVALLSPLLAENADNAHLHYLLGKATADSGKPAEAMEHYAKALGTDARYAADKRILSDALKQFSAKEDDEADKAKPVVTALLGSPAGPSARTSLYDLAIEGSWNARKRAKSTLEEAGQFESLEPWQKTAIELRATGKNCERVKKLVNELAESGEPRALPALQKTARRPTEGCGFLKKGDCYKCMRDDVKKAIARLEKAAK